MDWIVAHPEAATALATMALVAVGLVIGGGQVAVVWHGISAMRRSGERREREHDRRHGEAMDRLADERRESQERHREAMERHQEAMESLAEERRRSQERHREAMERHQEAMESLAEERRRSQERHREAMETIASQRKALETLIERTALRFAPGE